MSKSTCNEHVLFKSNTDVKPVKFFWKSDQTPEFWLWGPNGLKIGPLLLIHIVHISESSPNEHIKQDWCESRGKFLTKLWNTWILIYLEAWNGPKICASGAYLLHTHKSSSNELINQVSNESSGNISRKPINWPILGPKRDRKFGPQGPFFTHTWKYPQSLPSPPPPNFFQYFVKKNSVFWANFPYPLTCFIPDQKDSLLQLPLLLCWEPRS